MDLLCNVRTCRKRLTGILWVTRCSHSFCEEHARALTHGDVKCPACSTALGKRFDVIRQNSNPAEDFKAMLLVGLRPEIVLDVAMRAVSFWNYQVEQEFKFQLAAAKQYREIVEKMKTNNSMVLKQLATAKKAPEIYEKQIAELKFSVRQLKEQIVNKDRQLKKVQHLFDSFKSRASYVSPVLGNAPNDESFVAKNNEDLVNNAAKKSKSGDVLCLSHAFFHSNTKHKVCRMMRRVTRRRS